VWHPYRGIETADQANPAKLGSAQLNLMSLHLTMVWQLPIIEHKIGRHGGCLWKWLCPLDKPHDDDDGELRCECLLHAANALVMSAIHVGASIS